MNLKDLKKELPYKWRIQSCSKFKPSASCVAYIDARYVMDLLDEVVGAENWQDDYREVNGKLFAGIGINFEGNWVWKWDTGVESAVEKEKGQVSDSFKRAGVKWGIGRFLYNLKIHYVKTNEVKGSNNFPYPVDNKGQRIWDLTEHINSLNGSVPKEDSKLLILNKVKHFIGKDNPDIDTILKAILMMTGEEVKKEDLTQDKCKQLISKCK